MRFLSAEPSVPKRLLQDLTVIISKCIHRRCISRLLGHATDPNAYQ